MHFTEFSMIPVLSNVNLCTENRCLVLRDINDNFHISLQFSSGTILQKIGSFNVLSYLTESSVRVHACVSMRVISDERFNVLLIIYTELAVAKTKTN